MPDDVEANIAVVRRLVDRFVNEGNLDTADEIFAEDAVSYRPPPEPPAGREAVKRFVVELRAAFPGIRFAITHLFGSGDLVALNLMGEGVHGGDWHGVAPTGRPARIAAMSIFRMRDGRIIERHNMTDLGAIMAQITDP